MHSIRLARTEDAIAIADVHIASWRAGYGELIPADVLDEVLNRREMERRWNRLLVAPEPPNAQVLLICEGELVFGYSRFGSSRDMDSILDGDTGEVYGFYLHPGRWGRGLGRSLMSAVLEALADQGFRQATLNVIEANERARLFYERQGWTLNTEAVDWYGQPQVRYRIEL
ncbi:MAG TPA: GNAT family N-acetyltransferase [Actinomycetota bacterium]|nr:GNAT family N-acetyltransferase [Actinomycetota bacterium]